MNVIRVYIVWISQTTNKNMPGGGNVLSRGANVGKEARVCICILAWHSHVPLSKAPNLCWNLLPIL